MKAQDLPALGIASLSALIRERKVSPVEVIDATLARIAEVDTKLNSFITVTADRARESARRAEREIMAGAYRGPLHGIPVALKDLFATEGVVTTNGSKIFKDSVPRVDATVAKKLADAGAILVGKNNMHEFAMGSTTNNPHFGTCHNPWNLDHIPGGSSGGSGAAVAASLCLGSIGSDTGGSVRGPACQCGVVGLKPTYGLVSRQGVFPLSWSLDHAGPIAKSVEDVALLLGAIAGYDPADPSSASVDVPDYRARLDGNIRGLRVGVPREYYFQRSTEEVERIVREAINVLSAQGATIVDVSLPHIEQAPAAALAIISVEAADIHAEWLRTRPEDYGADVLPRLQMGALFRGIDYIRAQRIRTLVQREFSEVMDRVDVFVSPNNPVPPPRIDQQMIEFRGREVWVMSLMPSLTIPHNMSGYPAITVPCGFSASGVPVGLQIAGRAFDEVTVFRTAYAYEQATEWHHRRPNI
jgi:aspartyl-tRNA(Asn)/glutamyl-tRNA(Gln) amidotransferase subunit A